MGDGPGGGPEWHGAGATLRPTGDAVQPFGLRPPPNGTAAASAFPAGGSGTPRQPRAGGAGSPRVRAELRGEHVHPLRLLLTRGDGCVALDARRTPGPGPRRTRGGPAERSAGPPHRAWIR